MKYWLLALMLMVPGLASATDTLIVKQKVVEFAQPLGISVIGVPVTNLGLRYYYQIRTELTEEEVQRISDKVLESADITPNNQPHVEVPDNKPTGPAISDENELAKTVESIALTKCGTCHKAGSDSGFEIIREGKLNPELSILDWWNIFDRVDGSHLAKDKIMPKNGDPLTQEEVDSFRFYVRSLK